MRWPSRATARRFLLAAAALAVAASATLEASCLADRSGGVPAAAGGASLEAEARARPTAAAWAAWSRAQAAEGDARGAAAAAEVAARLAPLDASLAREADRRVDAALRATARDAARPAGAAGAVALALAGALAARRRRRAAAAARALRAAPSRLVVRAEGAPVAGPPVVGPRTTALVVDAFVPPAPPRVARAAPLVVVLSSADGGSVRLSPRRDWASGAARWRVEGARVAAVAGRPGPWRVTLRAGGVLLAEARLLVAAAA